MVEAIMLGLRTAKGIERERFAFRFDQEVEKLLDQQQCELFINSGHLISDSVGLRLSDEGMFLADEITRRLIR